MVTVRNESQCALRFTLRRPVAALSQKRQRKRCA
jgi:hypothetical protein